MTNDAILVTGASGFIGGYLAQALESSGHRVHRHSIEHGDIATCALEFKDVCRVFHLAGKTFVPASWEQPRGFYEVNVLGTANVLEFCRRTGACVTLISSYVYGKPQWLPIDENHPVQPLNPYAHSKILAEEIGRYYQAQFGVPVTTIRPFNIYGRGQDRRFLLPTLIRQALDPVCDRIVVADLRPRRDYIHVRDLIALLLATMERPTCNVYNAGSGRSVGIQEVVELINQLIGCVKPLESRQTPRPEEALDVVADISRAERELEWHPRVALAEGLLEMIEWMKVTP